MKKTLALVLAIMMVMTMSVTAWASEVDTSPKTLTGEDQSATIPVTGNYSNTVEYPHVISVDISWGAMVFTYSVGGQMVWQPGEHDYTPSEDYAAGWLKDGNTITVVNHSNVNVQATFGFTATADGITGAFTAQEEATDFANNVLILTVPGEHDPQDEAPKGTVVFDITGGEISESATLGTISVSIAKYYSNNIG